MAFLVNRLIYQFPGNNYFPPHTLYVGFSVLLMYLGFYLQFGQDSKITKAFKELTLLFLVMTILVTATNAAQYTPFPPIDHHLLTWQAWFPLEMQDYLTWRDAHPLIKTYLEYVYLSLTYQMTYLPLLIIFLGRTHRMREYYFLLMITGIIGYGFYYFFPTTAPASILENIPFAEEQRATGLKFNQIHQYIQPTTLEGGMIAFPSFHVIWAWLCVWLVRDWQILSLLLGMINLMLVAACVLLGWHYWIDVIGSLIVIGFAHYSYANCQHKNSALL
jgi:hypothetical protein